MPTTYQNLTPAHPTPWGPIQTLKAITDGIDHVTTGSHGGFHLSDERRAEMPDLLREIKTFAGDNWYEEDCDWGLVALSFPQFFDGYELWIAVKTIKTHHPKATIDEFLNHEPRGIIAARKIREFLAEAEGKFRIDSGSTHMTGVAYYVSGVLTQERYRLFITQEQLRVIRSLEELDSLNKPFTLDQARALGFSVTKEE